MRQWHEAPLLPHPDQEPPPLILVQIKLLDRYSLGLFAIGCFNRAVFAAAAHDGDAPASQIGGGGLLFAALHRRDTAGRNMLER
jgi:hypothetical protein